MATSGLELGRHGSVRTLATGHDPSRTAQNYVGLRTNRWQ